MKNASAPCDLATQIGKLRLKNPVIAASGTFGYGDQVSDLIDPATFGAICTKSLTLHPREGNPPQRIVETPSGMLNSIGLANIGVEAFLGEKLTFLRDLDTIVIVNVAGNTLTEYVEALQMLESAGGIDAYEINVSCPNVEGGLEFGSTPEAAASLTTALRRVTEKTLILKLSPNVTDIAAVAAAVVSSGADAVSLINTLVGLAVDAETRTAELGYGFGGLSGPAIKPVALAMVYNVAQAVDVPVIGMGGISSGEDAVEFMIAGATAVQIGTVNYVHPAACKEIVNALADYGTAHGHRRISEVTGTLEMQE